MSCSLNVLKSETQNFLSLRLDPTAASKSSMYKNHFFFLINCSCRRMGPWSIGGNPLKTLKKQICHSTVGLPWGVHMLACLGVSIYCFQQLTNILRQINTNHSYSNVNFVKHLSIEIHSYNVSLSHV